MACAMTTPPRLCPTRVTCPRLSGTTATPP
jgi:hypothetical protein